MSAADMAPGLVAGVWALVSVIAFIGAAHFSSRPRTQTISGGLDLVVFIVLSLTCLVSGIVAVTV